MGGHDNWKSGCCQSSTKFMSKFVMDISPLSLSVFLPTATVLCDLSNHQIQTSIPTISVANIHHQPPWEYFLPSVNRCPLVGPLCHLCLKYNDPEDAVNNTTRGDIYDNFLSRYQLRAPNTHRYILLVCFLT